MKPPDHPTSPFGNPPDTLRASRPSPWAHAVHKPVFIVFLIGLALSATTLFLGAREASPWLDGVLWLLAALTSFVGLARRLQTQNALVAATTTGALAFVFTLLSDQTAVPFGPRHFAELPGATLLGLPWFLPFLWIAVIITCRGTARLIMRPWRKTTYYGFWVIGLACALAVVFDLGFEPYAARVARYWYWQTHGDVLNWYSAPWVNFPGWLLVTGAILGFTTPWLINKQPVKQPTDYHPLLVWLLLTGYFGAGNALAGMWTATGLSALAGALTAVYAIRGGRW
jgi:uncharacterized membrane protein